MPFAEMEPPASRNGSGPKQTPWYKKEFSIGKAVKAEDLMNFSRQTASFLRAGIPLVDALAILSEDNNNKAMVAIVEGIRVSLQQGSGLAVSMSRHPKVFPSYYVSMVRSAELTGRLDDTMDQLSGYLERDLTELPDYCAAVARACDAKIPPNYPVVGADAFRTATGVAVVVDGLATGDGNRGHDLGRGLLTCWCGRQRAPRGRSRSRCCTRRSPGRRGRRTSGAWCSTSDTPGTRSC